MVALSSTEAVYMAMGHAVQEGLYLQMLQIEMGIGAEEVLYYWWITSQPSN